MQDFFTKKWKLLTKIGISGIIFLTVNAAKAHLDVAEYLHKDRQQKNNVNMIPPPPKKPPPRLRTSRPRPQSPRLQSPLVIKRPQNPYLVREVLYSETVETRDEPEVVQQPS